MLEYTVSLISTFKSWLHGLQFDLGLFFLILRPLIAVVILGACVYFILKPPNA